MAARIKKDDIVIVIAGKDKGRQGRVLQVMPEADRVVVQGVNIQVRHLKQNPQDPSQGGRKEREAPIHISNVMPWSDKDGKGVRVRAGEAKGKKVRVSAASGARIVAHAPAADAKPAKKKSGKEE